MLSKKAAEPVRHIPSVPATLLITCGWEEANGTVQSIGMGMTLTKSSGPPLVAGLLTTEVPVRRIRPSELSVRGLRLVVPKDELTYWVGMANLKRGFELNDSRMLENAAKVLNEIILPGRNRVRLASQSREDVAEYLGGVVSHALSEARLVFWRYGTPGTSRPAVFETAILCPDFSTTMAVRIVLDAGVRLCPQCGKLFNVTRKNSTCCCKEHANAYRSATYYANHKKKGKI
jgi:hypothetical protein